MPQEAPGREPDHGDFGFLFAVRPKSRYKGLVAGAAVELPTRFEEERHERGKVK
jgi:hypothetical protein